MGWKSTIEITREEALSAIMAKILYATDEELKDMLYALGYGDNTDLKWYGHNFSISDCIEENEDQGEVWPY